MCRTQTAKVKMSEAEMSDFEADFSLSDASNSEESESELYAEEGEVRPYQFEPRVDQRNREIGQNSGDVRRVDDDDTDRLHNRCWYVNI